MHSLACNVNRQFDDPEPMDPQKDRQAFGERVVRARLEFGLRQRPPRSVSQAEIAEAMGVTRMTVSNWEAGKPPSDLGIITKLAFVLGVRAAWLAFGEEPMRGGGEAPPTRGASRSASR
jgi:transcriptional regulator with XRE-family HTH domain